MDNLHCVSLNVRGLRGNKRHTIFKWLNDKKVDVCLLQETFCTASFSNVFDKNWKGKIIHSYSNTSHGRGVCMLLRKDLECTIIDTTTDDQGRFILVNMKINNCGYTICNVYCPNNVAKRIEFLNEAMSLIEIKAQFPKSMIVAGDFNCVVDEQDKVSTELDRSSHTLKTFKSKSDLVDSWRHTNDNCIEYTYIDPSPRGRNSRIDYIFLSTSLTSMIESSNRSQVPTPDHKCVITHLKVNTKKRGKGFWKLNGSILAHEEYENEMITLFQNIDDEYGGIANKIVLWDYIKIRVKQTSIAYCVKNAAKKRDKTKELENKLDEVDKLLAISPNEEHTAERNRLKTELDNHYLDKAKGYQIRSRAKWVQEGERSSKYFFSLEQSRQSRNCIDQLTDENGDTYQSDPEILKEINKYYNDLYHSSQPLMSDIDKYLGSISNTDRKQLSDADKLVCEGPITLDECTRALKHMKGNKSPGIDGISIEFYTKFWSKLGPKLVEAFNGGYDRGMLSDSQKKSVITLIFKSGDLADLSNYRPISVTNIDYKILAMVLANRLQNVIGSLINTDQSAYLKNRLMANNIRLVNDIIELFDRNDNSGMLLSIDFRKAFDTVEHSFLFKILEWYGFGNSFIRWILTMYNSPTACVKNNGHLCDDFSLSRGIRQGCPLSSLLFNLSVEILAMKIRQDESIKGFHFGNHSKAITISQYADDTILFLNDENETMYALDMVADFGLVSGLKLNRQKCEGYWLGREKDRQNNCTQFGIKWPNQIKYLGIYAGYNTELNDKKNWENRISRIKQILDSWKARELSIFGRIQVIKSLAISQITLPATTLSVPENIVSRLNSILFKFLWQTSEKIKRVKLVQSIKNGGLSMIDVESYIESIKASWICRIKAANLKEDSWAQIPMYYFRNAGIELQNMNYNFDDTVKFPELDDLPKFYRECFRSYNKAKVLHSDDFKLNIYNQYIWGNKFVCKKVGRKKNVLHFRNWIRSGIRKISDIRFTDGVLDEGIMYTKIVHKQNIYSELLTLKRALLPYKELLKANQHIITPDDNANTIIKSKQFYQLILAQNTENHPDLSNFLSEHAPNSNQGDIFTRKVSREKEIKLKEFNFKLLHGILPCNVNLKTWRIKDDNSCDLCNLPQTLEHLLYKCAYVQPSAHMCNQYGRK